MDAQQWHGDNAEIPGFQENAPLGHAAARRRQYEWVCKSNLGSSKLVGYHKQLCVLKPTLGTLTYSAACRARGIQRGPKLTSKPGDNMQEETKAYFLLLSLPHCLWTEVTAVKQERLNNTTVPTPFISSKAERDQFSVAKGCRVVLPPETAPFSQHCLA